MSKNHPDAVCEGNSYRNQLQLELKQPWAASEKQQRGERYASLCGQGEGGTKKTQQRRGRGEVAGEGKQRSKERWRQHTMGG
eukprot:761579-Hanusia_phi.AAC.5